MDGLKDPSGVQERTSVCGNQFARRLQAGMSHVNDSPVNDLPNSPFGGEKNSGLGRYEPTALDTLARRLPSIG